MHTAVLRGVVRRLAPLGALLLVVAACTSAAGPAGWTYAPPVTTPGPSGSAGASGGPSPSMSMSPGPSGSGAASGSPAATVFELTETASLQIVDPSGQQVSTLTVKKGQTYTFKITNTAGFAHNFYIGAPADLQAGNSATLKGIPDFASGTKEFQYSVASDGPLGFGCIVPGHYNTMHGTFTIQP